MKNLPHNHLLIITMPHSRVLKLISRSVLLSLLLLLFFPWIHNSSPTHHDIIQNGGASNNSTYLPLLFQDLFNQHLFKSGDQALLLLHTPNGDGHDDNVIVSINNNHHIQSVHHTFIPGHDTFDFVITTSASSESFIQPSLKVGGILVAELPSKPFNIPDNYKIVYVRRFHNNTILAMRKLSSNSLVGSRRLLERTSAAAAALDGLEDVMLEPPRGNHFHSPKINYLPDLTGDSLDAYPRRVFIDGGGTTSSIQWFKNNYPTRNTHFHIYNIHMVLAEESAAPPVPHPHPRVSEWLWKNVKEGEYVVMKAEADAVEDMLRTGAIGLVDELFLECNHQWQKGRKTKANNARRPYWECLALYGRLRDQGIAVHQWWES